MKWKAFTLLLSFAVLIFNPSFGGKEIVGEDHACCQKVEVKQHCEASSTTDQKENDDREDSNCCNNGCNPFVNCCGFMGFVIVQPYSFEVGAVESVRLKMDVLQAETSAYQGSVWEPPKS